MTFNEMFTYSSIAFMLVLLSVYYSKSLFNNTRTAVFRTLIVLTVLFTITELLPVYFLQYQTDYSKIASDGLPVLVTIAWKMHWCIGILWFASFFMYCVTIMKKIEVKTVIGLIKSSKLVIVSTIIYAVFLLAYISILKTEGLLDPKTLIINYLPGRTALYGIIFTFSIVIAIVLILIKNKQNINKDEKLTIIVGLLILSGTVIIQEFFLDLSCVPFGLVFVMYSFYFNLENPDLIIMKEINSAQGDIEKSNQTKTDFLSNMTYEIKVPMNLISTLCDELVNMSTFDEKLVREDIEQIQTSGNNLLDIINNILDISKIETGKATLLEREYKINEIVQNAINIAKSKIGTKPIKLVANVDQNISSVLYGDSAKLYQSLLNILGNAVKYTDVGRITFNLTSTKVSGAEKLLFKISDTGTGIKEEDQPKLFSKFTRLENAVENEIEGSGLGLVITKEYVESMGGRIWYETQYRVGTTFYIELTQKIVDATTIGSTVVTNKTDTSNQKLDCSQYTALIVDDNNLNIKVAKRLLEGYKFKIESVTAGKDCVYKVKEGMNFDIIFMDHMMPEMDGIETLHVLKKLDGYKLPPIIALTANAIAGMKEMYLNEGFDDYLSKPINTNELDRVVNKFFNK